MSKALSIRQPYADLIMRGLKTLEIRKWRTNYRGRLYICSCKKLYRPFGVDEKGRPLNAIAYDYGCLLGYVDLIDVRKMVLNDEPKAYIAYSPGLYAWVLTNPVKLEPLMITGKQRIFEIDLDKAKGKEWEAVLDWESPWTGGADTANGGDDGRNM